MKFKNKKYKALVLLVAVLLTFALFAILLTVFATGGINHTHTPATAVKENVVAATCKDAGSYEKVVYCSVCGKELSRTAKSIAKLTKHTPATADMTKWSTVPYVMRK